MNELDDFFNHFSHDLNSSNFSWDLWEFPKFNVPSFPVSNCYLENGDILIFEIAATGFVKEDLKIKVENYRITIEGKKEKDQKESQKYLWHNIAKRDFELCYNVSDKLDLNKLKSKLENGILKISIPFKEDQKPFIKEVEIE